MTFKLGLAQCTHPQPMSCDNVVAMVDSWCQRAVDEGVDLLVFPEGLMTRFEEEQGAFMEAAQPLDGPFSTAIDALAAKHGLWICYTMNEASEPVSAGAASNATAGAVKPFNTAVLVDSEGRKAGVYRKVHLYDAHSLRESDRMAKGSQLFAPVDTPFGRIGLSICYDLRFPEAARAAALDGCQVLLVPAAWVRGESKVMHWQTLLAARAIENEMFVAGVCRADHGYCGHSGIYSPTGTLVAGAPEAAGAPDSVDACETLVVGEIDLAAIDDVRQRMPLLEHRRPETYR